MYNSIIMKQMIYQVSLGYSKLYEHCIASVADYCESHGITHKVQRSPILRIKPDIFNTNRSTESYEKHGGFLPIYEKENAFEYLSEFDQVAIIDADIYIRPSSPNIFDEFGTDYDFGAVVERDMPIVPQYVNKLKNYTRMQYANLNDVDWQWDESGAKFYNMGMMVLNKSFTKYLRGQTPRQFIERPEFKRFVDGEGAWKWSTDQTLLNWWVKKEGMKIKDMPYVWNSLYTAVLPDYLKNSHFVHFFLKDKLPNKGENVEELMKEIQL